MMRYTPEMSFRHQNKILLLQHWAQKNFLFHRKQKKIDCIEWNFSLSLLKGPGNPFLARE